MGADHESGLSGGEDGVGEISAVEGKERKERRGELVLVQGGRGKTGNVRVRGVVHAEVD